MAVSVTKICDPERYRLNEAIQQAKSSAESAPGFEIELVRFLQTMCHRTTCPWRQYFEVWKFLAA